MALAAVIHFGKDDCQRVQALRHVGYKVRESESLDRLRIHLVRNRNVDAVIVSEPEPKSAEQAAVLVRQHTGAPLILFRRPDVAPDERKIAESRIDESRYDRVYSSRVPPANWLFDTAVLVMQSKGLRAQSKQLQREFEVPRSTSQALIAESRGVRKESKRVREQVAAQLKREITLSQPDPCHRG